MKKTFEVLFLIWLVVAFGWVMCVINTSDLHFQQYSYLAKSFLEGKLYFLEIPETLHDTVSYKGQYYWPLGIFPAVMLMLPVWVFEKFGTFFYQARLQPLLVVGVFYLVFRLAHKLGSREWDRGWWAAAFVMGSTFSGVGLLGWSWQLAQVVTTILLFGAISEYFGKRNYLILGTIMGMVFLSRPTAGLGIVFFVYEAWKSKDRWGNLKQLIWPFGVAVMVHLGYNFLRFGNGLESGYGWQNLGRELEKARGYGLFSLRHVPGNLYELFLSGPRPILQDGETMVLKWPFLRADMWGMAIWFTAPYLIKMFTMPLTQKWMKPMLWTSGVVALPILMYYGIGVMQMGYRYALDFLPWIHVVCMGQNAGKKLTSKYKALIFVSGLLNIYWFRSIFVG